MTGSKVTPYLEENLQLDYNLLEGPRCFCGTVKAIGGLLCTRCWKALDPTERDRLAAMKPGDGVASAASIAHRQLMRHGGKGAHG
jgi:hypothetical protein